MFFINTPNFWFKRPGIFLRGINAILATVYKARFRQKFKSDVAVFTIAIGGLTVGGAGKTPVTIEIVKMLISQGVRPLVGMRGYGRKSKGSFLVDPARHSYKDVGDEALIIARHADVAVVDDRRDLNGIALKNGFNAIILDDGFSQRQLRPNLKILVIDGNQGLGNGLFFPAGPLRFTPEMALQNSDFVALLNCGSSCGEFKILPNFFGDFNKIKIIFGNIESDFAGLSNDLILFSGLGCNEKFFGGFSRFNVLEKFEFPDHYPYRDADILRILEEREKWRAALNRNVDVATTEKDFYRIPDSLKREIKFVPIRIKFESDLADLCDNFRI